MSRQNGNVTDGRSQVHVHGAVLQTGSELACMDTLDGRFGW